MLDIEEYSIMLGVHYHTELIVTPLFNQGFKPRMSKVLGIKQSVLDKEDGTNE